MTTILKPTARKSRTVDYKRVSRPDYFNGHVTGLGIIPRRGFDLRSQEMLASIARDRSSTFRQLRLFTQTMPLRLLEVLCDTHPMSQMAISNDLSFGFAPGDTKIIAVDPKQAEKDEAGDEEGNAILDALWERIPVGTGGMNGLQQTIGNWTEVNGLPCVECVPGDRGEGLADIIDFSPYTVRFRDTPDWGRVFEQAQYDAPGGWQELDPNLCFAVGWRGSRDNPYGKPRVGAFLGEGLADTADQSNLRDVMKAIAWPHLAFTFPIEALMKFATDTPEACVDADGKRITAYQFAMMIKQSFMDVLPTLLADDGITLPGGADAKVLNAGEGLAGLDPMFKMRRLRLCQALDHLPALLGITDGGTQAYATVQWKQYAKKIEALRAFVNQYLVWIGNLELQLRGYALKAKAVVVPIETTDRFLEARARGLEIDNEFKFVRAGFKLANDACQTLTGNDLADEAKATEYFTQPEPAPSPQPAGDQGTEKQQESAE